MTSGPGIRIGDVLAGKYEVVEAIGQGGMGIVVEARHRALGQQVAIKVLRRDPAHDAELFARFEREARAAAKLKSRHAVKVTDVDHTADGTPFMVMELLEGQDLDLELGDRHRLDITEATTYVLQACSAMAEAHDLGIIHRDLKPHNLFLCQDGAERIVKVLDFGISKSTGDAAKNITQTASALGTPLYMSPEQIRSAKHVDERTDIWSLGVILYELLTGAPPFDGESPTAVVAAITADEAAPLWVMRQDAPRELSDIVMKALAKRPVDRYPDVRSFAAALAPWGRADTFVPPPQPSFPDGSSRTDLSAPGLAATQRSDTAGSWETQPYRRPLKRATKVVIAAAVVATLGTASVWWVASDGSGDGEAPVAESATPATETPAPTPSATTAPAVPSAPAPDTTVGPVASAPPSTSAPRPPKPPATQPKPPPAKPKPKPTATAPPHHL